MADGILAAVNENGNIDRFIDTKGGVHYIEPKRYEESVAKIDAAATKAKETVNSATEAVSECKAQTGACTQETARAKEIADTVESRITGIEGDVAALRDSVSQIDFDIITKDTIKLHGIVVNGIALITVHWTNKGEFWSSAWGDTLLARIKGLKAVHELHSMFIDNTGDPNNQSFRYLHVVDNGVYFRTAYGCNVPAGAWHMGHIAVPVTTV